MIVIAQSSATEDLIVLLLGALIGWFILRSCIYSAMKLHSEKVLAPLLAEQAKAIAQALKSQD